jgi:hypothetical protein
MSLLEVVRAWFGWSVPFAAKRHAVTFLQSLPSEYRHTGRVGFSPGIVEVTWGYPSWSTKTVHAMIDEYRIHFWIHQGDRSGSLWSFKRNASIQSVGTYMTNLLQQCGL